MNFLNRDPLISAGFGLALSILIIIGTLSFMNIRDMYTFDKLEEQSCDLIIATDELIASMKDAEIGELTFILTKEEKLIEPYRVALGQIEQHLSQLKNLTKDDQILQKRFNLVEPLIREKLVEVDSTIDTRRHAGFQAAHQKEFTDQHEMLADEIRRQLAEARDAIRQKLSREEILNEASAKKSILTLITGSILSFALLIATFVLLKKDIFRCKQAEKKIEKLNSILAVRADELEDSNRVLEAFNHTVAHSLRQPLNVISSYCQAVIEICNNKLDEQCQRYLQESYKGTLSMSRQMDALLSFTDLARVDLCQKTVDLSALAHTVAKELKMSDPERRIAFRITDGVSVEGDVDLLKMALDNLLGNALKYTGSREEAIIEFGVMETDATRSYFVRDNGVGFDMKSAGELFTAFNHMPGFEEYRGFGVGLAKVDRIIRKHGGRVWAESEPDRGATFYFTLQLPERNVRV